ncbi:MAG: pseudouridine synthase [Cyanobacteriota bacterium]
MPKAPGNGGSRRLPSHPSDPASIPECAIAPEEPQRLQKLLAAAGVCSRRQAEELLRQGRVRCNGRTASLGDRARPDLDRLEVDGQPVGTRPPEITLLLNKPAGVVCSCHDPQGRRTVLDLLPDVLARGTGLHPIGRLDVESRGALLLTNIGALTLRLTHPRYEHPKTYRVLLGGHPDPSSLEHWAQGVPLDGQPSQPVQLNQLHQDRRGCLLELVMREGRNRQIRRTAAALGHRVLDLQRIAIGPIALEDLPEGQWRRVDPREWSAWIALR